MPKIVDHAARRVELAEAVWRVIVRDGIDTVSIRSVAAESGWSAGALRYYFTTRAELLAFACDQVIDHVRERITTASAAHTAGRARARVALHETMPLDEQRRTEASIAFAFTVLGLSDPSLAAVQRRHFTAMHELCRYAVDVIDAERPHPRSGPARIRLATRLHALIDGLSLQGLAGYLDTHQMVAELDDFLHDIADQDQPPRQ